MAAYCLVHGSEDLAGKLAIHDGHNGSLVFVVHGKGSADEESSSCGTEIVGRDTEVLGIGCSVRRAKIGGGVGVYVGIPSANAEWKAIGISHSSDTRNL